MNKRLLLCIGIAASFSSGIMKSQEQPDSNRASWFAREDGQLATIKQALHRVMKMGFHGGKMWLGKWLFCRPKPLPSPNVTLYGQHRQYNPSENPAHAGLHRLGGGILFLHGLRGFIRACGFESISEFVRSMES